MTVTIQIDGIPAPQGSKVRTSYGMRESSQAVGPWREAVKAACHRAGTPRLTGAVRVDYEFRFTRPQAHYGTGRNAGRLKPSAPKWCTTRHAGDVDKLQRSTNDALVDVGTISDDSMIVAGMFERRWAIGAELSGATITITPLDE